MCPIRVNHYESDRQPVKFPTAQTPTRVTSYKYTCIHLPYMCTINNIQITSNVRNMLVLAVAQLKLYSSRVCW